MIVDSALYRAGSRMPVQVQTDDLEALRRQTQEDDFVWVGLHEPDAAEMHRVAAVFGLHPLAVEDSLHAAQRPKLERYGETMFLVLKTLWYVDEEDAVETGQVSVFMGSDYIVTVRVGEGVELATVRHGLEEHAAVLGHGPSAVVHAVCDRVVDGYEHVAQELETDVDEIEESVFSDGRTHDSKRIYVLKRELAEVRRAVHPLRAPMQQFALGGVDGMHPEAAPFFRDVADHVARVGEVIDGLDVLLSSAFEAHLARLSVQQNDDMRKISAWVAIAAVGTLIAGVYGMNFEHIPELGWLLGYPFALALMLGSSLYLYFQFRRRGWL